VVVAAALVVAVAGRAAGGPASASRVGGAASGAAVAGTGSVHVVRAGDTLWRIARARAGPDADPRPMVEALRDANGLETALLQPGTSLVVPPGP
jgi:nucleoid-associated protein YgaU